MKFFNYIILIFCITAFLYWMNYTSAVIVFMERGSSTVSIECADGDQFCSNTENAEIYKRTSVLGAILIMISAAGIALVALISGYSALYIIPAIILIAILNFVVFPMSFVLDPAIPEIIAYPLAVLFNILTVVAAVAFVRGDV